MADARTPFRTRSQQSNSSGRDQANFIDISSASPSPSRHRQSWSQELRGGLPALNSQRHGSLNQQALQELLTNAPPMDKAETRFANRDWKHIQVKEVVDADEVHFAEIDTSVEEATNMLVRGGPPNVVLVREHSNTRKVTQVFDYNKLNAYLLLVVGRAPIDTSHIPEFSNLASRAREGLPITLDEIRDIGPHEPVYSLPETSNLANAVEAFGSGVHRILLTDAKSGEVTGVLTQLRLVRFFWENGRYFSEIERIWPCSLQEMSFGQKAVISINGDRPLIDALTLMHNESVTSLPVLDNHRNVLGNISHVDVRLLVKSTSIPLLHSSCTHFISVILSERGIIDGRDPVPVFHVSPFSSLSHSIAKLVATRSHRLWIVDTPSPASSGPSTPAVASFSLGTSPALDTPLHVRDRVPSISSYNSISSSGPVAGMQGQHMSGRLTGVISLTDVLNIFARSSGLSPHEPDEARRMRRRSSSSSLRAASRASIDSARSEGVDLSRSASLKGPSSRR